MKCTFFVILLAAIIFCGANGNVVKRQADDRCNEEGGVAGRCYAYVPSFSYNKDTNSCYDFVYGGCAGTSNRFGSQEQCESACKH